MWEDPIVAEVRRIREELAAKFRTDTIFHDFFTAPVVFISLSN